MKSNIYKALYMISILLVILGLIMAVFSLIVILPQIDSTNIIIPLAFLILAIIGLLLMKYYKNKMKG
ncbi:hypothetical protein [uncultured Traorella sp.]|uniref:hypothetical protein n=1 Tax=uncultured Traorella sp. TaxID=1929048 RepID=UPI0025CCF775|nr:hypothetical protein [uncultured Traorella sp.]